MIKYIDAPGAISQIQQIIDEAKEKIILVSPYLQIAQNIEEKLKDADSRGVQIALVYGKQRDLNPDVKNVLGGLKRLRVYYYDDLHAKCYLNEKGMVITSMNLYKYSQSNREMGVYVTSDESIYASAHKDVQQIIKGSDPDLSIKAAGSSVIERRAKLINGSALTEKGYCIRCAVTVTLDPDKPLCISCYRGWSKYENEDYKESCCHQCGKNGNTSFRRPLCYSCYSEFERPGRGTHVYRRRTG